MDLRKLLQKVEMASVGSSELDDEFVSTFHAAPPNVTRSIDAAVQLIATELPGWWWNCGCCALLETARLSMSLAPAEFERTSRARVWIQTVNRPLSICTFFKSRGGVSFSTMVSIAIAAARFRLRC